MTLDTEGIMNHPTQVDVSRLGRAPRAALSPDNPLGSVRSKLAL